MQTKKIMKSKKNKLIITVETIAREFDYKLLLAREIAKYGFEIHIVQCDYFKLVLFNRSDCYVLLDKVLLDYKKNEDRKKILYNLESKSVKLIYLNEESAVLKNHDNIEKFEDELKSMYDASVFNEKNIVISPGRVQHVLTLKQTPCCELIQLGIPRFSLYSDSFKYIYETLVDQLLMEYGDFVLINTNYSLFNPATGIEDVFSLNHPENNISISDTTKDISLSYLNEGRQVFAFVELILEIAIKYQDVNFVIRPHPSEDPDYYKKFFIGQKNIFINDKGSVNELLLSCKALIHNGCTTAIEAYLAGIPVFNYNVISDSNFICTYPNEFGKSINNLEEFLSEFDIFLKNKGICTEDKELFRAGNPDYLFNIENNPSVLDDYIELVLRSLHEASIKCRSRIKYSFIGIVKLFLIIPLIHNFDFMFLRKSKLGKYFNSKRKFPGFKKQKFKLRYTMLNFHHQDEIKVNFLNNYHMKITNK